MNREVTDEQAQAVLDELNKQLSLAAKYDEIASTLRKKLHEVEGKRFAAIKSFMQSLPVPLSTFGKLSSWENEYHDKDLGCIVVSECGPYGMDRSDMSYGEVFPSIVEQRSKLTLEAVKKGLQEQQA